MKVSTEYRQALHDTRLALRYYNQERKYTQAHLTAWCDLAQELYPDTPQCLYADLRNAFVHGCLVGYEFVLVFSPPSCYDRLQADAFMSGVKHGEDVYADENYSDDEDY